MLIEVTGKDANTITYGYDPCHRDALVKFYDDAVRNDEIISWREVSGE
jgi:hypothetical protein